MFLTISKTPIQNLNPDPNQYANLLDKRIYKKSMRQ